MKKKLIPLVALSALLMGGLTTLAACNTKGQSGEPKSSEKIGAQFKVSYDQSEEYTVAGLKESYAAGEKVTFTVTVNDKTKEVSAVRAGGTKLTPDANGQYSFDMPEEDTRLRITLSDIHVAKLTASYTGSLVQGETLTITTKIDDANNDTFTVTAKTGASLVQITNHQVKLLNAGNVVLEVSATKDGATLKDELSFTIIESEASLGTDIAYHNYQFKNGAESLANDNRGTLIYWFGDGGSVSSFKYENGKFDVQYSMGWAFYGVQFFYSLPYAKAGDTYKLRWEVNSDADGIITINSTRVNLKKGDNIIGVDITQGAQATVSIQLGYIENEEQHPFTDGAHLTFKPFRLYDTNKDHKYHRVSFTSGNEVLKTIHVLDGQKVKAPEVKAPEGKIFAGFYNGETKFDENVAPTVDVTYAAKIIDKSEAETVLVQLKIGAKVLAKIDVVKGDKVVIPSGLDYGFGQKLKGLYTDAAFTTAFSLDTPVQSNLDLYVKTQIAFESTYVHDVGGMPAEWITYNDDGSITLKFKGWGHSDKWHIQANFTDSMIRGQAGEFYQISFTYSINQEGAGAQVYDGNTLDNTGLDVGSNKEATLTYEGGPHVGDFKLTFEFGSIDLDADVEFTLHKISIAKVS